MSWMLLGLLRFVVIMWVPLYPAFEVGFTRMIFISRVS